MNDIAGYTYGATAVAPSPISLDEFDKLKATILISDEDVHCLQIAGDVLTDQIDEILDL